MATDSFRYITFIEALLIHFDVMRFFGETHIGVADRPLIESALARPQQAAAYENASIFRQAATLCFGLIKNHPWVGGNKRTATAITEAFLFRNGWLMSYTHPEIVELSLAIESDFFGVDEIEAWYQQRASQIR
ncbi:MAG TPA: type II toxin-antitoxin system death-on-curing family toxin [Blastocatellia bacterium]|nr:type II toxin-antitoxin system death-on-curing family toxin [Blastocatellia bacterium]